jgi:hypothetical protein
MQTARSAATLFTSTQQLMLPAALLLLLAPASGSAAIGAEGEPPAGSSRVSGNGSGKSPGNPSGMSDPLRYIGGVRNSPGPRRLNSKQQSLVLKSLREKTGLLDLSFDENGFLHAADPLHYTGGSAAARDLLLAALASDQAFDLEAHPRARHVAFARLGPATSYQSRLTGAQINVAPVELDFDDFAQLRGDKRAIAAFDIALVILHELAHGVLGLRDVRSESDPLGECEAYINIIRRELNLPERQHYSARVIERPNVMGRSLIQQAELKFAGTTAQNKGAKREEFLLVWEAIQVGRIGNEEPAVNTRGTLASVQ